MSASFDPDELRKQVMERFNPLTSSSTPQETSQPSSSKPTASKSTSLPASMFEQALRNRMQNEEGVQISEEEKEEFRKKLSETSRIDILRSMLKGRG